MKFSLRSAAPAVSLLALCLPFRTVAQHASATGTVSGQVICADTGAPARFAKVLLKSAKPSHVGEDMVKNLTNSMQKASAKDGDDRVVPPQTPERQKQLAAAASGMDQVMDMLSATTVGLDGSFSVTGVAPGTYYLRVIYPGYVDPAASLTNEDLASSDPAVKARIAALPTVTITETGSPHVALQLVRGAAVSGRILYDDGSPASGWTVMPVPVGAEDDSYNSAATAMAPAMAIAGGGGSIKTDDQGRYRISGLPAGDYLVHATMSATPVGVSATNASDGGSGIFLSIYPGDTFTTSGAKPTKLAAGSEVAGVDINVPERRLHNITGKVVARGDGHALNFGNVVLTSKSIPSLRALAAVRQDGSFRFEALPGGFTYNLATQGAADAKRSAGKMNILGIPVPDSQILRKYETDTTDVTLSDKDLSTVQLSLVQTDWKPSPAAPGTTPTTLGAVLDGILTPTDDSKAGK